jgi:Fe-S cluster assembly ATPase SufC
VEKTLTSGEILNKENNIMNMEAVEKGVAGTGLIFDRPNDDSLVIYLTGGWQTGRFLAGIR